jgi:F-type H+-transporting ATPase subunit gamma
MSLKAVKSKIKSIDKTRQVTKAMEAVSAVKMRKSQTFALAARPHALAALKMLRNVSGSNEAAAHPLMHVREVKRTCLIIISADKGLAGSFGASLLKRAYKLIAEKGLDKKNTKLITVGKKAYEHFSAREWDIRQHFSAMGDNPSFASVAPLSMLAQEMFTKGECDELEIVYTNFVSTLTQNVYARKLLPLSYNAVEEVVRGITPEKGKFSEQVSDIPARMQEYAFEPSAETVLHRLIPELFNIQLFHSILESNASEHSARMIAMKNASDNAGEIARDLKLHFNKVRQSAITREVSEIVGGMEAMKTI